MNFRSDSIVDHYYGSEDLIPNEDPEQSLDTLFRARSRKGIYASTPTLIDYRLSQVR